MDFYPRQPEVPQKLRLDKGRQETPARPVHMDRDVESRLSLQLVEGYADLVHRLVLEGERNPKCHDNADSIFVAAFQNFLWSEQEPIAFHGNFADFDVEVATEFVPADLNRPHHKVRDIG